MEEVVDQPQWQEVDDQLQWKNVVASVEEPAAAMEEVVDQPAEMEEVVVLMRWTK